MSVNYHFHKTWQVLGVALIAFILTLSLMHKPPMTLPPFRFSDKLGHFAAYLTLMGWYVQLFRTARHRIIFFVLFVCMGVGVEVLQGMGGVRQFEWADALANTLGALTGFMLAKTSFENWLYRFEQRFLLRTSS